MMELNSLPNRKEYSAIIDLIHSALKNDQYLPLNLQQLEQKQDVLSLLSFPRKGINGDVNDGSAIRSMMDVYFDEIHNMRSRYHNILLTAGLKGSK
ncbi:MAG: hypothetical protein RMK80_03400 [Pseudobdellovibrionaceae bacterium]|nr:hypothetical protein [Pseudobdellovibrionaceae bacterium]